MGVAINRVCILCDKFDSLKFCATGSLEDACRIPYPRYNKVYNDIEVGVACVYMKCLGGHSKVEAYWKTMQITTGQLDEI
jgi:hypothetical protein